MQPFFSRVVVLYLGLGLIVRIVSGGALLSLGTVTTMILWPFIVAGWIVKVAVAVLVVAVVALAARGWVSSRAR